MPATYAVLRISQMLSSTYDFGTSRFLSAGEILESDLREQYCEPGGVSSNEFAPPPSPFGNVANTAALAILDSDVSQYITDNTDDEFSSAFLRAYLASKGPSTSESRPSERDTFPNLAKKYS
jgi:hypothetical protein